MKSLQDNSGESICQYIKTTLFSSVKSMVVVAKAVFKESFTQALTSIHTVRTIGSSSYVYV